MPSVIAYGCDDATTQFHPLQIDIREPGEGEIYFEGYRTKRVGFVVTFRLAGAEKSVLKLVGANLKDGQNVLVLLRFFGLLVRENPH